MDEFSGARFEGISNTVRRKRSQTSRRPKPEPQLFENCDKSPLSSTQPSDDVGRISGDEITDHDGSSKRKVLNLNQCVPNGPLVEDERAYKRIKEGGQNVFYSNGGLEDGIEQRQSGLYHKQSSEDFNSKHSELIGEEVANESKFKKVKLKVGGVTHTIQTKPTSHVASGSGSSTKSSKFSDAPRPRQKLILQDSSDEDNYPAPDKKCGLQGIPWKDFSKGGFSLGKEDFFTGKMPENRASRKQGEKPDRVHKSKRVPKKRDLNGAFNEDDEDDEIRYLEKVRTSKVVAGYRDIEEESSMKQRNLSRVSKGGTYDSSKDFGPSRSGKDGKKSRSERVSEDTDYEEEGELMSEGEAEGKKKKKQRKDSPDSPTESKREITLTTRQRALLSGKDTSPVSAANPIEFPNGLPLPPPRKQKDKLTEVEQQVKKAEAAERRRMQSEKAAQQSEAEAIRKILGQDSSRKKREDKLKKRKEDLAQEKAANAHMLAPRTVRCVMGPTGTTVTFSEDMGLPDIFDPNPCSYPPPREKCAGPSCNNAYKYRDSKSKLPLCSLRCYKSIHGGIQAATAC